MSKVSADPRQAADLFHALSDPTRIEIVQMLVDGERCVCELTEALDAAQSRLSFHLKTLKEAGVVSDRKEGRWIYYSLRRETMEEIEAMANALKPSRTLRVVNKCCD